MTGAELNDKSEQSSAVLPAEWIHSQRGDRILCRLFIMCTYRLGAVISVSVSMCDLLVYKCQPIRPLNFEEPKKEKGNCNFSSIKQ